MGWNWLDPIVSLAISIVILIGTFKLFIQSLHLLFDGVPDGIDAQQVHDYLAALPGVVCVPDMHIWAMGTTQIALTAHLVMPDSHPDDLFYRGAIDTLQKKFEISHVTIQINKEALSNPCCEDVYTQ
jgi:cobalt-zinc-cadmium efflux system protein